MLQFVGCGSAFNTKLGNNVAYIKKEKTLLLIDCGSSTFAQLIEKDLLVGIENVHVLMTHLHPDHVGSLGDLIFYGYFYLGEMGVPSVTVHCPRGLEIKKLLHLMGVQKNVYTLQFTDETGLVEEQDLHLSYKLIPQTHTNTLDAFGYVLKYEDQTIYYSGDANDISPDILEQLHAGYFDYFYQDTCKAEYEGNVHLPLSFLNTLVQPNVRSKVYCMHLDNGFKNEDAYALGFQVVSPHK